MQTFKVSSYSGMERTLSRYKDMGVSKHTLQKALTDLGLFGLDTLQNPENSLGICHNLSQKIEQDLGFIDVGYDLLGEIFVNNFPFCRHETYEQSWEEGGFRRLWCLFLAQLLDTDNYTLPITDELKEHLVERPMIEQIS